MVTAGLAARLDARAGRSASWFRPYVAGYYAYHLLGEDLSREEVEARMEALLAAGQPWRH